MSNLIVLRMCPRFGANSGVGEMLKLKVVTRTGRKLELEGTIGTSVMQTITQAGVDELLAICGGSLSCATCHVYVEDAYKDKIPEMTANEKDLLDGSQYRTAASRLSCQIVLDEALDGFCVTIAPED
jgi:ferredoxin, 2Fe-2S